MTANLNFVFLAETHQNLVLVCLVAFITVMTILSILALIFRGLTHFFAVAPEPPAKAEPATTDAATVGAIHAAVARAVPGGRATRIEAVDKN